MNRFIPRGDRTRPGHADDNGSVIDMVLIGGGIMSTTLGSMLSILEPGLKVVLLERGDALGAESSDSWNNAGTGHNGYCELNYMPDPVDDRKASSIARDYLITREWWSFLSEQGLLEPESFIHPVPHMNVVFGSRDVEYLRTRFHTMTTNPLFCGMEFSDDPAEIAHWAPLVMAGRLITEPVAATRVWSGTDVDFGSLTRALAGIIESVDGEVRVRHEVHDLSRDAAGVWRVRGRKADGGFELRARRVFVGAGGNALRLLQKAQLPEIRGYGVLPIGASFLRTADADLVTQHDAKVYGQAGDGAPPMSVPHLDRRVVGDATYLMFGPYPTLRTKLLKSGHVTDAFKTLRPHNLRTITSAIVRNLGLVRYLIRELLARPSSRFAQLTAYLPTARRAEWEWVQAGQRAQLVTPDERGLGVLQQGTELVIAQDGSIAGLLGASPGASTAVSIMFDVLSHCFPEYWTTSWRSALDAIVPNRDAPWDGPRVEESLRKSGLMLRLGGDADR